MQKEHRRRSQPFAISLACRLSLWSEARGTDGWLRTPGGAPWWRHLERVCREANRLARSRWPLFAQRRWARSMEVVSHQEEMARGARCHSREAMRHLAEPRSSSSAASLSGVCPVSRPRAVRAAKRITFGAPTKGPKSREVRILTHAPAPPSLLPGGAFFTSAPLTCWILGGLGSWPKSSSAR